MTERFPCVQASISSTQAIYAREVLVEFPLLSQLHFYFSFKLIIFSFSLNYKSRNPISYPYL